MFKISHAEIHQLMLKIDPSKKKFSDSIDESLDNNLVFIADGLNQLSCIDKVNNIRNLSVLQNSLFNLEDKMNVVCHLSKTNYFGENFSFFNGEIFSSSFDQSSDRENIIDHLFLNSQTQQDLVKNQHLYQVALELVMNAQIDAPKLSKIKNEKPSKLIFEKNKDKNLFAISVIDYYGSLDPNKMIQQIYKVLQHGFLESMSRKSYGAGLGSAIIFDCCDSLYIGVENNQITRVSVVLPYAVSNTKMEQIQKSLILITE